MKEKERVVSIKSQNWNPDGKPPRKRGRLRGEKAATWGSAIRGDPPLAQGFQRGRTPFCTDSATRETEGWNT